MANLETQAHLVKALKSQAFFQNQIQSTTAQAVYPLYSMFYHNGIIRQPEYTN